MITLIRNTYTLTDTSHQMQCCGLLGRTGFARTFKTANLEHSDLGSRSSYSMLGSDTRVAINHLLRMRVT